MGSSESEPMVIEVDDVFGFPNGEGIKLLSYGKQYRALIRHTDGKWLNRVISGPSEKLPAWLKERQAVKEPKLTDAELTEKYPRPAGYVWLRGKTVTERKATREKRNDDYMARVAEKRKAGVNR